MAVADGRVAPGLVHHSDQGVQYASGDYTELLSEHGILISMSRPGNPYDNAQAESFIKTLKYEEVYRTEYRDLADAYAYRRIHRTCLQRATPSLRFGLCAAHGVRAECRGHSMR